MAVVETKMEIWKVTSLSKTGTIMATENTKESRWMTREEREALAIESNGMTLAVSSRCSSGNVRIRK